MDDCTVQAALARLYAAIDGAVLTLGEAQATADRAYGTLEAARRAIARVHAIRPDRDPPAGPPQRAAPTPSARE